MTWFDLVKYIVLKYITSEQVAWWDFGKFFVPFGIPKIIVVDVDGFFSGVLRNISRRP